MSWAVGYSHKHKRDIGYGVPAICDHPECNEEIDRGLSHLCGDIPYGSSYGCGLHFCSDHLETAEKDNECINLCERCLAGEPEFTPKPDTKEWQEWKLTDESWAKWREENPDLVSSILTKLEA